MKSRNVKEVSLEKMCIRDRTEGLKDITGGSVIINPDPVASAEILESEILDRRKGLGLSLIHISQVQLSQ